MAVLKFVESNDQLTISKDQRSYAYRCTAAVIVAILLVAVFGFWGSNIVRRALLGPSHLGPPDAFAPFFMLLVGAMFYINIRRDLMVARTGDVFRLDRASRLLRHNGTVLGSFDDVQEIEIRRAPSNRNSQGVTYYFVNLTMRNSVTYEVANEASYEWDWGSHELYRSAARIADFMGVALVNTANIAAAPNVMMVDR